MITDNFSLQDKDQLIKARDVAAMLQVSKSFAYQLMQRKIIPTVKINRAIRVRLSDLHEYIQKHWSGWSAQGE